MSQPVPHTGLRFLITSSQGPRSEQQDSGVCLHNDAEDTALIVVGDGVGGRSGGRIASQKVVALASELWEERKGQLANPAEDLATLCQVAHERINSEGSKLGISPRTTIVALYLTPTNAWWVHSGDSRLYHFRAGQLVNRTEDHSLLELMVQHGAVKEQDMGSHPNQNTLLQSLGGEEYMPPSAGTAAITPDDGFLLCSDGFWERTTPEEMAELVFTTREEATERLAQAVERAVERNGPKGDNVTVAVARPAKMAQVAAVVDPAPASRSPLTLFAVAAVLLAFAALLFLWPEHRAPVSVETAVSTEKAVSKAVPVEVPAAAAETPIPKAIPVEKPITPEAALPSDPVPEKATPSVGPTPIAVPLHPFRADSAEPHRPKLHDSGQQGSLKDQAKSAN